MNKRRTLKYEEKISAAALIRVITVVNNYERPNMLL